MEDVDIIKTMAEFARKMEKAEVLYCDDHEFEYLSGDECSDCQRDRKEFEIETEMKDRRRLIINVDGGRE